MPPTRTIHLDDRHCPSPSQRLLARLTSHLPHSLPVLRRLQFAANFAGGRTPHTRILHAHFQPEDLDHEGHFAAAARGGHAYPHRWAGDEREEALDLVLAVFRRIRAVAAGDHSRADRAPDGSGNGGQRKVLVGSLHETVRQGLLARGVKMEKSLVVPQELDWEFCGKWLFRIEDLPDLNAGGALPGGMRWDKIRSGDVRIVQGRTSIQRQEATLLMLPSTVVRLDDGTPVAWAFLGLDGTIITLHVEEPYRRLGIAKVLACKLMREHLPDYGDDGWGAADVFVENHKSQALCRSIGGKNSWTLSWAVIDLSSVGFPL